MNRLKFNVGDTVRVINSNATAYMSCGEIVGCRYLVFKPNVYTVKITSTGSKFRLSESSLELASPTEDNAMKTDQNDHEEAEYDRVWTLIYSEYYDPIKKLSDVTGKDGADMFYGKMNAAIEYFEDQGHELYDERMYMTDGSRLYKFRQTTTGILVE